MPCRARPAAGWCDADTPRPARLPTKGPTATQLPLSKTRRGRGAGARAGPRPPTRPLRHKAASVAWRADPRPPSPPTDRRGWHRLECHPLRSEGGDGSRGFVFFFLLVVFCCCGRVGGRVFVFV